MHHSRKLKNGILISSNSLSGAEKRALKLYHFLNENGIECHFLLNEVLLDYINKSNYNFYLGSNFFVYDHWNLFKKLLNQVLLIIGWRNEVFKWLHKDRIKRYGEKNRFSFLHVFMDPEYALIKRQRIVFEITSPDIVNLLKLKDKDFFQEISIFTAVSRGVFNRAKNLIAEEKLRLVPGPFFYPNEEINNYNELFEKKQNIIVFAHRFIPRKNAVLFAEAVKDLFKRNNLGWKVKILGKGPEKSIIEGILQDEISQGKVEINHTNDLFSELKKSKIFVSLITPDNYPSQSVLEAMYTGNALLLSDTGLSKEMFFSENGELCKLEHFSVLNNLCNLTTDSELRKYGENSINLVNERFSRENYLEFYQEYFNFA